jgi:pentatricopeptide repeat protein
MLADVYARLGEPDKAMDYAERMRDLTGPHIFLLLQMEPGLDNLRDHPRYLKLQGEYDVWLTRKSG